MSRFESMLRMGVVIPLFLAGIATASAQPAGQPMTGRMCGNVPCGSPQAQQRRPQPAAGIQQQQIQQMQQQKAAQPQQMQQRQQQMQQQKAAQQQQMQQRQQQMQQQKAAQQQQMQQRQQQMQQQKAAQQQQMQQRQQQMLQQKAAQQQQMQQQKLQMQQQKATQQQQLQQQRQQAQQQRQQQMLQMQQQKATQQQQLQQQRQQQLQMQQQQKLQMQQQKLQGQGRPMPGNMQGQGLQPQPGIMPAQGVQQGQGVRPMPGQGFQQRPGNPQGQGFRPVPGGMPGQGNPQGQGFQQRPGNMPGPGFQPGQQVRRDKGGIGPAGAAAIGLGVGVVGGYILSNQLRGVSEVHQHRESYVDNGVTYVREPGRVIIREQGGRAFIRHDETERFAILGYKPQVVREGDFYRSFYDRPDGVRVITVTDADGNLIRRIRRYRDGREVIIIDNGFRPRPVRFVDHVIVVPPPVLTIPRERYIVDASESDEGTIYETLTAPPLSRLTRRYTLDEVRYSPDLRAQVRSVEVNSVTFDSGSWNVEQSQVSRLSVIAAAINKAIEANPEAVFLIEGHTDAVGDADDNLSLSDRRAQSVAEILTRDFGIPAENLTTQGYGETQLKVQTEGDARANRRVVIRNITSLIAASAEESQGGQAPQQ